MLSEMCRAGGNLGISSPRTGFRHQVVCPGSCRPETQATATRTLRRKVTGKGQSKESLELDTKRSLFVHLSATVRYPEASRFSLKDLQQEQTWQGPWRRSL